MNWTKLIDKDPPIGMLFILKRGGYLVFGKRPKDDGHFIFGTMCSSNGRIKNALRGTLAGHKRSYPYAEYMLIEEWKDEVK